MKVDSPTDTDSCVWILVKTPSNMPIVALSAGTKLPMWAKNAIIPIWNDRIQVTETPIILKSSMGHSWQNTPQEHYFIRHLLLMPHCFIYYLLLIAYYFVYLLLIAHYFICYLLLIAYNFICYLLLIQH